MIVMYTKLGNWGYRSYTPQPIELKLCTSD